MKNEFNVASNDTLFVDLVADIEETILIINKLDTYVGPEILRLVTDLYRDAQYFSLEQKPEYYPVYIAHVLREIIEKFFYPKGNNYTLPKIVEPVVLKKDLVKLVDISEYGCFESFSNSEVRINKLIEKGELEKLLQLSTDPSWHSFIWKINTAYGGTEGNIKKFKAKHFINTIAPLYSMDATTMETILSQRSNLYSRLSNYSHLRLGDSTSISRLIEVLRIPPNERSEENKDIIEEYVGVIKRSLGLFKNFELTTTEKINKLEELING